MKRFLIVMIWFLLVETVSAQEIHKISIVSNRQAVLSLCNSGLHSDEEQCKEFQVQPFQEISLTNALGEYRLKVTTANDNPVSFYNKIMPDFHYCVIFDESMKVGLDISKPKEDADGDCISGDKDFCPEINAVGFGTDGCPEFSLAELLVQSNEMKKNLKPGRGLAFFYPFNFDDTEEVKRVKNDAAKLNQLYRIPVYPLELNKTDDPKKISVRRDYKASGEWRFEGEFNPSLASAIQTRSTSVEHEKEVKAQPKTEEASSRSIPKTKGDTTALPVLAKEEKKAITSEPDKVEITYEDGGSGGGGSSRLSFLLGFAPYFILGEYQVNSLDIETNIQRKEFSFQFFLGVEWELNDLISFYGDITPFSGITTDGKTPFSGGLGFNWLPVGRAFFMSFGARYLALRLDGIKPNEDLWAGEIGFRSEFSKHWGAGIQIMMGVGTKTFEIVYEDQTGKEVDKGFGLGVSLPFWWRY